MRIKDYEVPEAVEIAAEEIMRRTSPFSLFQFEYGLHQMGVPGAHVGRLADRLLQRARKAGRIEHCTSMWRITTP